MLQGARRIAIVGGGFSGATTAVQLVRRSPAPLAITIIEPRARIGGGLAYSSDEPDHRINGQPGLHSLDPLEQDMFVRWCDQAGAARADPQATLANGTTFPRRSTFRAYLEETVARHAAWSSGSTILHVRDRAGDILPTGNAFSVMTAGGERHACDLVILAPGHTGARLPAAFGSQAPTQAGIIADPLGASRLPPIAPQERVLVLGSGLTAYDIVSTLVSRGHAGTIDVVSRHGLKPKLQRKPPEPGQPPPLPILERDAVAPESFILSAGSPPTVRALLHALRQRVDDLARSGETWDGPFDHLRDIIRQFWPSLAATEKRRFFRHLRPWYDIHRFRVAPQNQAIVSAAEARGQVRFRAARVEGAAPGDDGGSIRVVLRAHGAGPAQAARYDRVINCTGVDATPHATLPLYAALLERGLISLDPSGVGVAVDARCRAIGRDSRVAERLRVVGPPTLGAHGDASGGAFIAVQIHRMIPDALGVLGIIT